MEVIVLKLNRSKLIEHVCEQLSEKKIFSKNGIALSESDLNGISEMLDAVEADDFDTVSQSNFIDLDKHEDEILGVAARLKARKDRFVYSTGQCDLESNAMLTKVDEITVKLIVNLSVMIGGHLTYVHEDWHWNELTAGRFASVDQSARYLSQIFDCSIEEIPDHLNSLGTHYGFVYDQIDTDSYGSISEEDVYEILEANLNAAKLNQFFIVRTLGYEDFTDKTLEYSTTFEITIDLKDYGTE